MSGTYTYQYADSDWGDLLTAYHGRVYSYDEIGNPLSDGLRTYTWINGREMHSVTQDGTTFFMAYNADGLRTKRVSTSTAYNYYYSGSQLRQMYVNSLGLYFRYDANGTPLSVTYGGTVYYYITNLQGDVTAIVDGDGTTVVSYTYDAWGKILSTTGSLANTLGKHNPLRYRGYIYDAETGLYYLSSRYYDPEIGRFINSDVLASTGQGTLGNNMFAYCGNNPVIRVDRGGTFWDIILDVASLCLSVAEVAQDPSDVGAWVGLACDVVDVLVPVVSGLGETARAIDAGLEVVDTIDDIYDAADDVYDAVKVADNVADSVDNATDTYKIASDGLCFVAGTLVHTDDGYVAIQNIEAGDLVWAWDEVTETTTLKEVVETYVSNTCELVHIYVNGEEIIATPSHPFYSPITGWTDAAHLHSGDVLVLVNDEYVAVEKVQHETLTSPVTVYNFQVEEYHTYYVSASGVLVHNSCAQPFRYDENQQAVIDLAKEYKLGLNKQEAEILVGWADEYGIKAHMPMTHPGQSGYWSDKIHINIRKLHIPVLD